MENLLFTIQFEKDTFILLYQDITERYRDVWLQALGFLATDYNLSVLPHNLDICHLKNT
jgi:hypothetical protein